MIAYTMPQQVFEKRIKQAIDLAREFPQIEAEIFVRQITMSVFGANEAIFNRDWA